MSGSRFGKAADGSNLKTYCDLLRLQPFALRKRVEEWLKEGEMDGFPDL